MTDEELKKELLGIDECVDLNKVERKLLKAKVTKPKNMTTCPDCDGNKLDVMDDSMYCPFCGGEGKIPHSQLKFDGGQQVLEPVAVKAKEMTMSEAKLLFDSPR